jgi:signal transduction histidine kinase
MFVISSGRVRVSQEGLRDYIGVITAAQEDERLRLARELHDETIQELIVLKQRLELGQKGSKDPGAASILDELRGLTETTIDSVRRMTRALRPIFLEDLGLAAALQMLAREISQAHGPDVQFRSIGSERRLSHEAELALYRIAQQALNNVVRHAQAKQVAITLEFLDDTLRLQVVDDGQGFTPPPVITDLAARGHFGLLGMRERAELIGAALTLESRAGAGTTLRVRMPIAQPESAHRAS